MDNILNELLNEINITAFNKLSDLNITTTHQIYEGAYITRYYWCKDSADELLVGMSHSLDEESEGDFYFTENGKWFLWNSILQREILLNVLPKIETIEDNIPNE